MPHAFARRPWLALSIVALLAAPAPADGLHTADGKHPIDTIELTTVYLVPKDRRPLPDWRRRVDYFMDRIEAFHRRELDGRSTLKIHVHPEPLVSDRAADDFRKGDQNFTFFQTTGEAQKALDWPGKGGDGFPILLVLSDINWRELDDFRRERLVDGKPQFEGSLTPEGRHVPGAESGGARATYDARRGLGLGLVSADGWRVPYSGSDCVVYHEGLGHPIGLPHPEPIDDSVMGTAQYHHWLNQARLDDKQKRSLGWEASDAKPSPKLALFTAFTAIPAPTAPKAGEPVTLRLTWPAGARVRRLSVETQTDLFAPWTDRSPQPTDEPPSTVPLGTFDEPTPVSYRVRAELEDGQSVEFWGYFVCKP